MASEAFYSAESFEDMTDQIGACLQDPVALQEARESICRELVMDVDGQAADRVAQGIIEGVTL